MDYTLFDDISEVPKNMKTYVGKVDPDDPQTLVITPMRWGREINGKEEETIVSVADVNFDPLKNIPENAKVFIEKEAEGLFEHMQDYSRVFNECGGNLEVIADTMEKEEQDHREFEQLEEDEEDSYDWLAKRAV